MPNLTGRGVNDSLLKLWGNSLINSKFDCRNPKQISIANDKTWKIKFGIFEFRHLKLFRISDFVLRNSGMFYEQIPLKTLNVWQ